LTKAIIPGIIPVLSNVNQGELAEVAATFPAYLRYNMHNLPG